MKKIAIIKKTEDKNIYAEYKNLKNRSKAFFKVKQNRSFLVYNKKNLDLHIDDLIEIYIEPKSAIIVSFLIFILPLIFFVLFYSITNSTNEDIPEYLKILFGFSGIIVSYVLTFIIYKIFPEKHPEVIRVVTKTEADSCSKSCGSCNACG
ncbi:MAG: hypothetical protein GY756_00045 [bacterium]|nr:hypothetical protein [bacterium]